MARCVILGSAFDEAAFAGRTLTREIVKTPLGDVALHRVAGADGGYVLFRHGVPHRFLPHQIPYVAQALALKAVGCRALLITSSVGVLDPRVPLFTPLLGGDVLMLDNRLPDGSTCTVFREAGEGGHLVVGEHLFSPELSRAVETLHGGAMPRVTFAYVGGPRTKTPAENRALRALGAQVNSMTVGPEAVLAAELGIAVCGLFVGHKRSGARDYDVPDEHAADLAASLREARAKTERLALGFLTDVAAPAAQDRLFRFTKS